MITARQYTTHYFPCLYDLVQLGFNISKKLRDHSKIQEQIVTYSLSFRNVSPCVKIIRKCECFLLLLVNEDLQLDTNVVQMWM